MPPSRSFTCDAPRCSASYRRKEHLTRHKARHLPQQANECPICGRSFGRNDTLRRHMRQSHPPSQPTPPLRQACTNCQARKARCEGRSPCSRCRLLQLSCWFGGQASRSPTDQSSPSDSTDKIRFFLQSYFNKFHPHWPIIHRASFNSSQEFPLLIQSMVAIGMWVTGVARTREAAITLHAKLNTAIHEQREKWDASTAEILSDSPSWPMPVYQAILLHVIFSLLSKGSTGITLGLDLKVSLPTADTDLLASVIQGCRVLDLFHYPTILAKVEPANVLPYIWVTIEEVKRFGVALYRTCNLLSSGARPDSTESNNAMDAGWKLTASELRFPPPTNEALWHKVSKNDWLASATADLERIRSGEIMEPEWISNSAGLLEIVGI